ncbi:hypothetical protein Baya_14643 [Bagarius yarrelli]|uniref:Uncharacterized protein n=1 Tax=Bagarius yarrelli TaxID=175774 RepID=A0A556V9C5_BAGYA|nr:hypothetical protein Baya_14643 [Bagarius yarrelli]
MDITAFLLHHCVPSQLPTISPPHHCVITRTLTWTSLLHLQNINMDITASPPEHWHRHHCFTSLNNNIDVTASPLEHWQWISSASPLDTLEHIDILCSPLDTGIDILCFTSGTLAWTSLLHLWNTGMDITASPLEHWHRHHCFTSGTITWTSLLHLWNTGIDITASTSSRTITWTSLLHLWNTGMDITASPLEQ